MSQDDADEVEVEFGDNDPEDAYDQEDPFEERLGVLERAIDDIRDRLDERREARREAIDGLVREIERTAVAFLDRVREMRDKLDAL